jgi:DNA polymerase III epsilon subunit-like protein
MPQQSTNPAPLQLRLPELPEAAADYAVFDLETTGLQPATCQIIEIGWCVVRGGRTAQPRAVLVRCESGVPFVVQDLTGITPAMLAAQGVGLPEALDLFLADTAGLPLVGHNVLRFDMPFLEAACRATGRRAPARPLYRDTAAMYKAQRIGLRPRPGQDHWSFANEALDRRAPGVRFGLSVCCDALGIGRHGVTQHRAAGDVVLTQQLYHRLVLDGAY